MIRGLESLAMASSRAQGRAQPILSAKGFARYRACRSIFLFLLPAVCICVLSQAASAQQTCIDVQVDGQRRPPLECLNQQLQENARAASPANPQQPILDVVGNGEPNKVGTFSFTGEKERMGANFGHSAIPQRPSQTFSAIGATRP